MDKLPEYKETLLEDELISVFEKMGMKNEGIELVDLIKIMPSRYMNDERPIVRDYATSIFKNEEPTIESLTETCNKLQHALKEGNERLSCLERVVRDIVISDIPDRGTLSLKRAVLTRDWRSVEFFIKCGASMSGVFSCLNDPQPSDYTSYHIINAQQLATKYKVIYEIPSKTDNENAWRYRAELFRNWINDSQPSEFANNNPTFTNYFNY